MQESRISDLDMICKTKLFLFSGKAPWMEIETSEFSGDWLKTLQDPRFHDVTFLVEGVRHLHAHRIILSSASKFFGKVLASTMPCTVCDKVVTLLDF